MDLFRHSVYQTLDPDSTDSSLYKDCGGYVYVITQRHSVTDLIHKSHDFLCNYNILITYSVWSRYEYCGGN